MPKKPSAYYRPKTISDAGRLLAQPDTYILAGGTSLLAKDVNGAVVDLQALGMDQLDWVNGRLQIGAMVTLAHLSNGLEQQPPTTPAAMLRQAIGFAGPNTIRNAGTIGGTVAVCPPDSELLAALLVLDATLTLAGPGEENLTLLEYLAARERPSGIITSISLPWEAGQGRSFRVARTPKDDPIVSITGWMPVNASMLLAATGIGPKPCRLPQAEDAAAEGNVTKAVLSAKNACIHPGDFRGDTAYRAEMAAVLTRRVLTWQN